MVARRHVSFAIVVAATAGSSAAAGQCAPPRAAAETQRPVESAASRHADLRKELGAPLPTAPTRITLWGAGGHLATVRISILATRAPDASWHVSTVRQSTIWIDGAAPDNSIAPDRVLTADKGSRLDAMLADPCLYAEPDDFSAPWKGAPPLGVLVGVLEITTPKRHRLASGLGGGIGRAGEVIALLDGR